MMAGSNKPGPYNHPVGICRVPARTGGPLGFNDQADPNVTTLLGDTHGPLGSNDYADPVLPLKQFLSEIGAGMQVRSSDGVPLSVGQKKPDTVVAVNTEVKWEDLLTDFIRWEGKVSHMYLDTKGLVTVGVGKMLPNAAAAKLLGFVRRADKVAATPEEIEMDFNEVSKQTKGKLASSYAKNTVLDLPDQAIEGLLKSVSKEFESKLEKNFKGYLTYPVQVKRALMDMIYNLGLGGLLKFKKLKTSIESKDWLKASKECHRNGPSDERNEWTRDLFAEAAKK